MGYGVDRPHYLRVWNIDQHPYKHKLPEFQYLNPALPGISNLDDVIDWLVSVIYPNTQGAVATPAVLPVSITPTITIASPGVLTAASHKRQNNDELYLQTSGALPTGLVAGTKYFVVEADTNTFQLALTESGTAINTSGTQSGVHTIDNTLNDYRVVLDDGDGKAAAYRWQSRLGGAEAWYKQYDMDWSEDSILSGIVSKTQDMWVSRQGTRDIDSAGSYITGTFAGQRIIGGSVTNTNMTLTANNADTTGYIQTTNTLRPSANNTYDLGTSAERWKDGYFYNSVVVGSASMTLSAGSITDSSGAISFGNENLSTTGDFSGKDVTATSSFIVGTTTIAAASITDSSGAISFGNENLSTTGTLAAEDVTLTKNTFTLIFSADDGAGKSTILSSQGEISFGNENLTTTGKITVADIDATNTDTDTLTVNTSFAGSAFLDDDSMATATDSTAASSESIKAYFDNSLSDIWDNNMCSNLSGPSTAFEITDAGSATVNISAGNLYIKTTDSIVGHIVKIAYAGETGVSVPTDNTLNWAYLAYSTGTAALAFTTTLSDMNLNTEVVVAKVFRSGNVLTIWNLGQRFSNYRSNACKKDFELFGMQRATGLILSAPAASKVAVEAGVIYCSQNRLTIAAIDTNVASTFSTWNSSSSVTADTTGITDVDNANYWNGSALVSLTTNRRTTRFFYVDFDGGLHMQWGTSNVTSVGAALAEEIPATPSFLTNFSIYVGRIVLQEGETTYEEITNPFSTPESAVSVTDHGDLSGLADDDHTQYLLRADILDEDNMATDSDTVPPSQQSTKAFVTSGTVVMTSKSIDADNNTITNLELDNLKAGVLDTDLSAVSGSDDTVASAKAIDAFMTTHISDTTPHATITNSSLVTPSRLDVKQGTEADLTTYAATASNGQMCFATDTKKMYQVVDSALTEVGGGGAGSSDTIHLLIANNFTDIDDVDLTGNDASFDGGGAITEAPTLSTTAADLILDNDETVVIKYVPAADGSSDYFGFTKGIDQGYRGRMIGFAFEFKNESTTVDNDFRFCVKIKDGANAGLITYKNMEAYSPANNESKSFQTAIFIPTDCTEIEFGWQNTSATTTVELYVDNILVSAKPYQYVDLETTQEYSITQADSAVTDKTGEIEFDLSAATITNTGASTIYAEDDSGNTRTKYIASIKCSVVVAFQTRAALADSYSIIYKNGVSWAQSSDTTGANRWEHVSAPIDLEAGEYFTVGLDSGKEMANPGSANMSFVATAKSEHVVTAAESVVEHCHYYDAAGYGSTNTKIPYLNDTAYDTLSTLGTVQNDSTNGWSFTASKKCVVDMNWSWSSHNGWGGLTKNSAALTTNFTSQSGTVIVSTGYSNFAAYNNISVLSFSGILEVGDVLRPHTNGGTLRTGDTDCHITIKATPANASVLIAIPVVKSCYLKDAKSAGTNGGTFTTGSWQTRDLNVLNEDGGTSNDGCSWCVLSSNRFTVPAGTYDLYATLPARIVNSTKCRLYDITNSVDAIIGATMGNGGSLETNSVIDGTITPTVPTTYEIQHYCTLTSATNGFGYPSNIDSKSEVYTQVRITKIK